MGSAAVHVIARAGHTASVLHALRLRLLGELGEAEVAAELARRLGVPRQLVNYHLSLPTRARRLVETMGERRKRNCTERLVRAVALLRDQPVGVRLARRPPRKWRSTTTARRLVAAGIAS
jgi:DNA-binding transcriptional ArsR family regulator